MEHVRLGQIRLSVPVGGVSVNPPGREWAGCGDTGLHPRDEKHAQTYHGLPGVDSSLLTLPGCVSHEEDAFKVCAEERWFLLLETRGTLETLESQTRLPFYKH